MLMTWGIWPKANLKLIFFTTGKLKNINCITHYAHSIFNTVKNDALPLWPEDAKKCLQPHDNVEGYAYFLVIIVERIVKEFYRHYCSYCCK